MDRLVNKFFDKHSSTIVSMIIGLFIYYSLDEEIKYQNRLVDKVEDIKDEISQLKFSKDIESSD
jgi:hypothetical protein